MKKFMQVMRDERGQGLTEYGLIIALIAIVCIAALVLLGGNVRDKFEEINDGLDAGA